MRIDVLHGANPVHLVTEPDQFLATETDYNDRLLVTEPNEPDQAYWNEMY